MVLKLYNRDGLEKGSYIFPDDIFSIAGYSPDNPEECGILETYAKDRLEELALPDGEEAEIRINKGLNFPLVAVLNVFARMGKPVTVGHYDREAPEPDTYHGQRVDPPELDARDGGEVKSVESDARGGEEAKSVESDARDGRNAAVSIQLTRGRHTHPDTRGLDSIYPTDIPGEMLFDFEKLVETAREKISGLDGETVRIYSSGLSQCLVSAIVACRKLHRKLVILHYNARTDEYFEQGSE